MNNEKELRLLTALTEIYKYTIIETRLSVTKILRKHRVCYVDAVYKIIKEHSIILTTRVGSFNIVKWNSSFPDLIMVKSVFKSLEQFKENNKNKCNRETYEFKYANAEVLVKESNMLKDKLGELKIALKYADTNEFKLAVYEKFINEINK